MTCNSHNTHFSMNIQLKSINLFKLIVSKLTFSRFDWVDGNWVPRLNRGGGRRLKLKSVRFQLNFHQSIRIISHLDFFSLPLTYRYTRRPTNQRKKKKKYPQMGVLNVHHFSPPHTAFCLLTFTSFYVSLLRLASSGGFARLAPNSRVRRAITIWKAHKSDGLINAFVIIVAIPQRF